MFLYEEQEVSRIARSSVNDWLKRNTFCCGAEVAPVQCKRGLGYSTEREFILNI